MSVHVPIHVRWMKSSGGEPLKLRSHLRPQLTLRFIRKGKPHPGEIWIGQQSSAADGADAVGFGPI
jgi:hypothetical protein